MRSRSLLYIVFCLLFLTACYNRGQQSPDAWDLTEHQLDSISFSTTHHYTQNYNFMVTANRLPLADALPDMAFDTLYVVRGDRVVVADIQKVPADTIDSVWVKVAHDQITQGWIRESELLQGVSPAICVLVAGAYAVRKLLRRRAYIVHFHDIDSAYPALLCVLIAMSATLYASIQMFGAESWRHYYFHPSLNPFALPLHLGLFVASVWAIIIMAVAVLDDVRHQLPTFDALLYLSGLTAVCAVIYVVFTIFTLYYVGYLLLMAYIAFAVWCYQRHPHYPYRCGQCGGKMKKKGTCPHCGAVNA